MALLAGRVAVITGAGRGIGARAAELLARHGASVVINDMSAEVLTNSFKLLLLNFGSDLPFGYLLMPHALPVAQGSFCNILV
jgi:NAD(P)-dependent dehydrogenase (short-subunit alcohol dehydrogenase family)